ncbi:hypothetical protein [Pseudomonas psychrophila]|uniref:hypothetical protein n=1 Tax=Pseudomonas psychrophila TaxID=122355 RepID=UPI000381E0CD|nr:hypothetical protein [Pseudomonas psychrophila]
MLPLDELNITIRRQINGDTSNVEYLLDGKPARHKLLLSKRAKQAGNFKLIHKDLEYVEKSLAILTTINSSTFFNIDSNDDIVKRSLFTSSVITYGKCFATGELRGVKLDISFIKKIFTPKLLSRHKNIIEIRNKYIAHANTETHEKAHTFIAFDHNPPPNRQPRTYTHAEFTAAPPLEVTHEFLQLTTLLKNRIEEKIRELLDAVMEEPETKKIIIEQAIADLQEHSDTNGIVWSFI